MDLWKAFTHLYTIMFEQWLTTTFTILEYFTTGSKYSSSNATSPSNLNHCEANRKKCYENRLFVGAAVWKEEIWPKPFRYIGTGDEVIKYHLQILLLTLREFKPID